MDAIVWLASERASFITGQTIRLMAVPTAVCLEFFFLAAANVSDGRQESMKSSSPAASRVSKMNGEGALGVRQAR